MSADRDTHENVGFTTKQKAMTAGVVVILLVLVWQVYGLVGGSGGDSATPAPVAANNKSMQPGMKPQGQMTSTMPGGNQPGAMPMQNTANNFNNQMPQNMAPQQVMPQPLSGKDNQNMTNAEVLKKQKDQQEKYLTTVNELQMLKLQKDIAETNQAISAAKLATATAEKNINDMLIKPIQAPTPVSNYASSLVTPAATGSQMIGPNGLASPPPPIVTGPPDVGPVPYVVISVSMQMNKWTAVLGASGKLYNVSTGDVMSDGWVVGRISKEGVVLKKTGVSKKVSLIPVI